jgi:hypothetical protein
MLGADGRNRRDCLLAYLQLSFRQYARVTTDLDANRAKKLLESTRNGLGDCLKPVKELLARSK